MMKSTYVLLAAILISIAIGLYAYPHLPESMATHWDMHGNVNGYMSRAWGLATMPLMLLVIGLLLIAVPYIDPLKKNIQEFLPAYEGFVIVFVLFMLALHFYIILWNMGYHMSISRTLPLGIAALYAYMGFLLQKAKRNWFIGIRTPWTMSSDAVWDKTHKVGAKLFMASGMIALAGILFPTYSIYFIIIPVIFTALFTTAYSYYVYNQS